MIAIVTEPLAVARLRKETLPLRLSRKPGWTTAPSGAVTGELLVFRSRTAVTLNERPTCPPKSAPTEAVRSVTSPAEVIAIPPAIVTEPRPSRLADAWTSTVMPDCPSVMSNSPLIESTLGTPALPPIWSEPPTWKPTVFAGKLMVWSTGCPPASVMTAPVVRLIS